MADPTWESTTPVAAPAQATQAPTWNDTVDLNSIPEMAKTAVEQGLSGATLGLSKVAETHLLGVDPKAISARESANPITSTVSNLGGTAALIGATGGLGGLAEGAGLGARAAALGAEGAGVGGITSATDDWSQDKPLDAQKMIASAGIGAALGLTGAGLVGAGKAANPALQKTLNYFGEKASGAAQGEGWLANLAKAYQASSDKAGSFASDLTDHVSELYHHAKGTVKKTVIDPFTKTAREISVPNPLQAATEDLENNFAKPSANLDPFTKKKLDPSLIKQAFEDPAKAESLHNFLNEAVPNTDGVNKAEGFQKGLDALENQVNRTKAFPEKQQVLDQIKAAKENKKGGLGLFTLIEALPESLAPLKIPALALRKYWGNEGALILGSEAGSAANKARSLGKHIENTSDKIGSKLETLFRSSTGQAKKVIH